MRNTKQDRLQQPLRWVGKLAGVLGLGLSVLAVAGASGPVISVKGSKAATTESVGGDRFAFLLKATKDQPLVDAYGGRDLVEQTDLSGSPFTRDAITIAGWKLARYRRQGPHLIAMQNTDLGIHMRELERRVPELVPADFTGLVVIDYEPWWALWERTINQPSSEAFDAIDNDYLDDWRDYIRAERSYLLQGVPAADQEQIFQRTYEAFVKTFLLATYYKCKQIRPRAKWSFYNYPQMLVVSDLTPNGVQGYGDLTHEASRLNDQIAWYFEAVDFVAPRIYPPRKLLERWPAPDRQPGEISPQVHEQWLSSMVRESVRLAGGKPVYPMHSAIYYARFEFGREPVTRHQHEQVFRILAENGASGVIVWHAVSTQEELDTWFRLWTEELKPAGVTADRAINGSGG